MSNEPEARETPQDDTTRLEQTVQNQTSRNDPTEQLDLPDATRAIDVQEQETAETDDGPIRFDAPPSAADQPATGPSPAEHGRDEHGRDEHGRRAPLGAGRQPCPSGRAGRTHPPSCWGWCAWPSPASCWPRSSAR